jgi:hypothetical protein
MGLRLLLRLLLLHAARGRSLQRGCCGEGRELLLAGAAPSHCHEHLFIVIVNMIVELQDSRTAPPCAIKFLPREDLALQFGDACVASVDLPAQEQQCLLVLQRGDVELVA